MSINLKIPLLMLLLSLTLSACQTVPLVESHRTSFSGPSFLEIGQVYIGAFHIPKEEPVTTLAPLWKMCTTKLLSDVDDSKAGLTEEGRERRNGQLFTRYGVKQQLASPDLEADWQGALVSVVSEGIPVQTSKNGHLSLVVTRVDDLMAANDNEWRKVA